MLTSQIREVYIAQHAVDFRKGPDGLLAECYAMDLDPYKGECVIFIHRSRRAIKVICGDEFGLCVLLRRFEGGAMRALFPFLADRAFVSTTHAQLAMLLEGATFEVKSTVKPWRASNGAGVPGSPVLPKAAYEQKVAQGNNETEQQSKGQRRANDRS